MTFTITMLDLKVEVTSVAFLSKWYFSIKNSFNSSIPFNSLATLKRTDPCRIGSLAWPHLPPGVSMQKLQAQDSSSFRSAKNMERPASTVKFKCPGEHCLFPKYLIVFPGRNSLILWLSAWATCHKNEVKFSLQRQL